MVQDGVLGIAGSTEMRNVGLCLRFTAHRDCDWNPRGKVRGARRRNLEERGCLCGTGKGVHVYVMHMFIFPVSTTPSSRFLAFSNQVGTWSSAGPAEDLH